MGILLQFLYYFYNGKQARIKAEMVRYARNLNILIPFCGTIFLDEEKKCIDIIGKPENHVKKIENKNEASR